MIEEFHNEEDKHQETKIDISKNIDSHENLGGMSYARKNFRIDVFYGKERMFLTIHCPQPKRKEFNKKLEKKIIIPKPKVKSSTITLSKPHNKDEKN